MSPPLSMEIFAWYLQLLFGPVAARHSHRRPFGNRYKLARPFQTAVSVSTLQSTQSTPLLVCTSHIQNPTVSMKSRRISTRVPSRVDYHSLVDFLFVQPGDILLLPSQRLLHAAPHYRVTQRTRWAKSPKARYESPTMSIPPIFPSHDTSSRTVPRPSPYSFDVASH